MRASTALRLRGCYRQIEKSLRVHDWGAGSRAGGDRARRTSSVTDRVQLV